MKRTKYFSFDKKDIRNFNSVFYQTEELKCRVDESKPGRNSHDRSGMEEVECVPKRSKALVK